MKKIAVFGATGSIGKSTLAVVSENPNLFKIVMATAHTDECGLLAVQKNFGTEKIALTSRCRVGDLQKMLASSCAEIVVNGVCGAAGLDISRIALESGCDLALANKETIVMAGDLIKTLAKDCGKRILPVDSEHSAIFSLIEKCGKNNVAEIILTASGGPFRELPKEDLANVTLDAALAHPTWKMGRKITVDSATLANKGLEVIEASRLFNVASSQISVLVHPQSIVHSLVRTNDGVLYAQMSSTTMKNPIFAALSYPDCQRNVNEKLDLTKCKNLEFFAPRFDDFPLLPMAFDALEQGGGCTIAYNAANEVAVEAFLQEKIRFPDICETVAKTLAKGWHDAPRDFAEVAQIDAAARKTAKNVLGCF